MVLKMSENMPNLETSVFAHGIKNKLSFIRAKLQLIELEKEEKGAFDSIYKELDSINISVSEFISAPSKQNENTLFNAKDIIYECILEKLPEANLNGIKIYHDISNNLNLYAPLSPFRETIINLIQNSIEACPLTDGKIFIKGHLSRDFIYITISDNGKGISKKDMKKLFTPFFTTKPKGHGIGLFSSKDFAKNLGGTLKIKNLPEKGCSVTLKLPKKD